MTMRPPCPTEPPAPHPGRSPTGTMRTLVLAVWAVPILVLGQFAMLAVLPVVLVAVRTARAAGLRALRWWAGALVAAYATPLLLWWIGPDRARSLSKDMSPTVTGGLVAVSVAVAVAFTVKAAQLRGRRRGPATSGSPG